MILVFRFSDGLILVYNNSHLRPIIHFFRRLFFVIKLSYNCHIISTVKINFLGGTCLVKLTLRDKYVIIRPEK